MALLRRREEDEGGSAEDEREALRRQRELAAAELEGLKAELADRVRSVHEKERELDEQLRRAAAGVVPAKRLPTHGDVDLERALQARAAEIERRETAVAAREAALEDDSAENVLAFARDREQLEARNAALAAYEAELDRRERALAEREQAPLPEPGSEQLARIERRLAELREAERLFLRTQEELAARSEALTARERLVADRERELDEREDAAGAGPGLSALEERLRRLEQRQPPGETTQTFGSGLRRLSQEGTRRPR